MGERTLHARGVVGYATIPRSKMDLQGASALKLMASPKRGQLLCTAAQLAEIEAGESLNEGTYEDSQNEGGGSSAGIVVGCLAGVAVVAAAGAVVYKRRAAQSSLLSENFGVYPQRKLPSIIPQPQPQSRPPLAFALFPQIGIASKMRHPENFYFWNERTDATSWDRPTN